MAQFEVGEFWACSLLDFYGWTSAPVSPDAAPLAANRARMYYNSLDNSIHIIDSNGNDLLGNEPEPPSVLLNPTGDQTISGPFNLILDGGIVFSMGAQIEPMSFSALAAPSSATEGSIAAIVDSTTNTWGATISGGGTFHVLGYNDGSVWSVIGL